MQFFFIKMNVITVSKLYEICDYFMQNENVVRKSVSETGLANNK